MHAHDKKDGRKQHTHITRLRHSPVHHHYSPPLINLPLWPIILFSRNVTASVLKKGRINLKKDGIIKRRGRCVCHGRRGSQNTEGRTQNICVTPDLCVVNNFNSKDGYFMWRRTWKTRTNVVHHLRLVSLGLNVSPTPMNLWDNDYLNGGVKPYVPVQKHQR